MELEYKTAFLLLGSNLGDRVGYINEAIDLIGRRAGIIVLKSAVYETQAWGKTDQPGFLNVAIGIETNLSPIALLGELLSIEKELGRTREEKWGARFIDIDIILYGEEIVEIENELQIPHPQMQHRKFVLQPLAEIAEEAMHPVLKQSVANILAQTNDLLAVRKHEETSP